ncbi:hypothetical protein ACFWBX_33020 [Streptomyces sp. NPDC059991]|uniref:hypothetical protein n=1 Tax=Streptomyces sp. NPDC059991 TaxID=3347028 RepID=UPI0036CDA08E
MLLSAFPCHAAMMVQEGNPPCQSIAGIIWDEQPEHPEQEGQAGECADQAGSPPRHACDRGPKDLASVAAMFLKSQTRQASLSIRAAEQTIGHIVRHIGDERQALETRRDREGVGAEDSQLPPSRAVVVNSLVEEPDCQEGSDFVLVGTTGVQPYGVVAGDSGLGSARLLTCVERTDAGGRLASACGHASPRHCPASASGSHT